MSDDLGDMLGQDRLLAAQARATHAIDQLGAAVKLHPNDAVRPLAATTMALAETMLHQIPDMYMAWTMALMDYWTSVTLSPNPEATFSIQGVIDQLLADGRLADELANSVAHVSRIVASTDLGAHVLETERLISELLEGDQ